MRRIASVALVLVAAAAAVVLTASRNDRAPSGFHFKMAFDNAFGLSEGGDLRVGGVKAGKTTKFTVSKGPWCQGQTPSDGPPRTCAVVSGLVSETGFQSFRKDAHCDIRQQSLIGEYYVDCQPGHSPNPMKSGATLPDTQTTSTIPPDLVGDVLRRPYRDRLRLIIAELGTGLAGRPQDVAELLQKADPGLRETQKVLRILGSQRTVIKNFISNSNTVVRELDQRKADLVRWIQAAGRAADVSASRRTAIAAGFQRLPTFLSELRGTMARLQDVTDAQTPLLHNLQAAAPSLNTFLQRLGPFSQASRPAIRSLGDMSVAGSRALVHSRQDISTLRQLAVDAPGAAKPLRQLLQTMDNRNRSMQPNDKQTANGYAPPPPDPQSFAKTKRHGLTGFEAILNYTYWQTMSLNEFDSIGHVLRATALTDPMCSPFINDLRPGSSKQDQTRERCNSFLGPNQPGITTPEGGRAAGRSASKASTGSGGQKPDATKPLPGQKDLSRPNPTLAPSQRDLLNSLQGGKSPSSPSPSAPALPSNAGGTTGAAAHVLDYLLAP